MFPASAGMNRRIGSARLPGGNVPRKRGDEPHKKGAGQDLAGCSPQARG